MPNPFAMFNSGPQERFANHQQRMSIPLPPMPLPNYQPDASKQFISALAADPYFRAQQQLGLEPFKLSNMGIPPQKKMPPPQNDLFSRMTVKPGLALQSLLALQAMQNLNNNHNMLNHLDPFAGTERTAMPNTMHYVKPELATLLQNQKKKKALSSTFRGVSWHKRDRAWVARIWNNGKSEHLGTFHSEERAAVAVDMKAIEYFGSHGAGLNFPDEAERKRILDTHVQSRRKRRRTQQPQQQKPSVESTTIEAPVEKAASVEEPKLDLDTQSKKQRT
eukprot:CAMPEP_0203749198 /NCGR_PEP_ID=MMETSP0098-20131031/3844_1 /ASSEMBLY_ACC=CAM_ASM_000208 /TAXON_ID=96639 /ORGANISM=" , Strain NY0313808BC1" /LENGTH=276 /DNA_ID=CAMNT_0050638185 /DNA_START=240 /DNA_END=1070 /DNA_ORIENTATION=+